jgi:hypothetical protein
MLLDGLPLQYVAFLQFTLEISKPSGEAGNHSPHAIADNLLQSRQQLHFLTVEIAVFRDKVASIGSSEATRDRIDRIWVLLTWLNAFKAFGRKNVGSVVSKLVDELAAFLGIGEAEPNTLAARTLDKGLDELGSCRFMWLIKSN